MTDEEWAIWERLAVKPDVYDPPQLSSAYGCGYSLLRLSCCCCAPCVRWACCSGLGLRHVAISSPDDWFEAMLSQDHPNCPEALRGVFWMEDNVAAEGVLTLQDGDWATPRFMTKSSRYNWTVDAGNLWGMYLTWHFWRNGGRHLFSVSPSGRWIQISTLVGHENFIYVLQPGDIVRRPDGTIVDVTPGEDLMRISYDTLWDTRRPAFQYLLRRVATLREDGTLVKTRGYQELARVAVESAQPCRDGSARHIDRVQVLTLAPAAAERCRPLVWTAAGAAAGASSCRYQPLTTQESVLGCCPLGCSM